MEPHELRVIAERDELCERRRKLSAFIESDTFRTIDQAEQERLWLQVGIMGLYKDVLRMRIEAFADKYRAKTI